MRNMASLSCQTHCFLFSCEPVCNSRFENDSSYTIVTYREINETATTLAC